MATEERQAGFFENFLMGLGIFTGAVLGYENGEFIGLVLGALIFGALGKWLGRITDGIIAFILVVVLILLNSVLRRIITQFFLALFE